MVSRSGSDQAFIYKGVQCKGKRWEVVGNSDSSRMKTKIGEYFKTG